MTFFCGVCGCRGFWHQIEGDQQVPSIPVIAHKLIHVCVPVKRSVSVSFGAEFHFTAPFFKLYLFISAYKENKEIMNGDKEIYVVSNFTVLCHIILLLLAVLQCCLWKGSCLSGFRRMWNFSITSHAVWVFNCGPSTRNACIKGVLLYTLLMVWWDRSRIQVQHRDLGCALTEMGPFYRVRLLFRVEHNQIW